MPPTGRFRTPEECAKPGPATPANPVRLPADTQVPIGVAMQRALTPVEARGGIISGRIIRILIISSAAAAVALAIAWLAISPA